MAKFSTWVLVSLAIFSLFVPTVAIANGKVAIHLLDVGQGDAALLISPQSETVLVDNGALGLCSRAPFRICATSKSPRSTIRLLATIRLITSTVRQNCWDGFRLSIFLMTAIVNTELEPSADTFQRLVRSCRAGDH